MAVKMFKIQEVRRLARFLSSETMLKFDFFKKSDDLSTGCVSRSSNTFCRVENMH